MQRKIKLSRFSVVVSIIAGILIISVVFFGFQFLKSSSVIPSTDQQQASNSSVPQNKNADLLVKDYTPKLTLPNNGGYTITFIRDSSDTPSTSISITIPVMEWKENSEVQNWFNDLQKKSADNFLNTPQLPANSMESNCKYQFSVELSTELENSRYLSFRESTYTYLCGAHGDYNSSSVTFDLVLKKALSNNEILMTSSDYQTAIYKLVRGRICDGRKGSMDSPDGCYKLNLYNPTTQGEFGYLMSETEPTKENYQQYYLVPEGVVFTFEPYNSYDNKALVYYDELAPYLKLTF